MATIIRITDDTPALLTPGEVARLLRVDRKTLYRWERAGKLAARARTPGGQRRYDRAEVEKFLNGDSR